MLRTLSVQDFVIVDSIELDFDSGFSALTGETGAGKSILIDALALVLGGRADPGMIREGAEKADIRAEFNAADKVADWLKANEIVCEDESVLVRRTIGPFRKVERVRQRCAGDGIADARSGDDAGRYSWAACASVVAQTG